MIFDHGVDRLPRVMHGESLRWLYDCTVLDRYVAISDDGRAVLQAWTWPEFTWRHHPATWATSKEMCAQ